MDKFSVDLKRLEKDLEPPKTVFKYADVKDRLERVAFDVVRFMDADNIDGLWQIQKRDDGEVIVAMYDLPDYEYPQEKQASAWSAATDMAGNINIFYKNQAVTKVALASLGLDNEDPTSVAHTLANNLATNSKLQSAFIANLTATERKELLDTNPELKG